MGSGEPDCPDGTFAAGYTMDTWESWRIVCLAALSMEDIEDLPIRNHDNRYFADWIRLCPGLSKNSEDGNICPKPHKGARLDWSCGKSGQHWDWDYQSQYGFYQGEAHGFTKENVLYWRPKWTERVSWKIGMRLLAPKKKQSYLFLAPLHSGLGKAVAGIYPGRAMQWDALASSPTLQTLQTLQTLPLPRPLTSVCFEPPACQAGLTSAGLVAAGLDGCLLGRIHFPCGYVVYVLLCCWGVFPVLTLYSPRSIVWGLLFFLLTFLMLCCIFLQFYLHFNTDYTLYDCVCDE